MCNGLINIISPGMPRRLQIELVQKCNIDIVRYGHTSVHVYVMYNVCEVLVMLQLAGTSQLEEYHFALVKELSSSKR